MRQTHFLSAVIACVALAVGGSAFASDQVITISGDVSLTDAERSATMRVVDLENVTVYGDDWEQIAPGLMELRTENGIVRHVFGDDGLAWKIQTLRDEAHELRFKAQLSPDEIRRRGDVEARIQELELLQQGIKVRDLMQKTVRPGATGRLDPCDPRDFELTAGGGSKQNYLGLWFVNSWAHSSNFGSVCTATGTVTAYLKILEGQTEVSREAQGTSFDEQTGVAWPSWGNPDPVQCWERESSATYEDNRYFEVTSYGFSSPPCW